MHPHFRQALVAASAAAAALQEAPPAAAAAASHTSSSPAKASGTVTPAAGASPSVHLAAATGISAQGVMAEAVDAMQDLTLTQQQQQQQHHPYLPLPLPDDEPLAAAVPGHTAAGSSTCDNNDDSSSSNSHILSGLSAMLNALHKDRSSVMARVTDTVQRATPTTPLAAQAPSAAAAAAGPVVQWDEQLMSGILELNQIRRSLAITCLTWGAALQNPSLFTQVLLASVSTGNSSNSQGADADADMSSSQGVLADPRSQLLQPNSPLSAAAVAAVDALATMGSGDSWGGGGSAHGGSMFHFTPALAAQRMGFADASMGALMYNIVSELFVIDCVCSMLLCLCIACFVILVHGMFCFVRHCAYECEYGLT